MAVRVAVVSARIYSIILLYLFSIMASFEKWAVKNGVPIKVRDPISIDMYVIGDLLISLLNFRISCSFFIV